MTQMFSKAAPTPAPAPPPVIAPPTMPDPMSPATLEARRQAMQKANAGGRSSTILSTAGSRPSPSGTLAGSYGSAKLGS